MSWTEISKLSMLVNQDGSKTTGKLRYASEELINEISSSTSSWGITTAQFSQGKIQLNQNNTLVDINKKIKPNSCSPVDNRSTIRTIELSAQLTIIVWGKKKKSMDKTPEILQKP